MKKISLRTVLIFSLAGLSGTLLLHTSQRVQQAEDEARRLQASLEQEREAIRVLKAEWAYLNSPQRLEALATEYLGLVPSDPGRIMTDAPPLPDRTEELFHNIAQEAEDPSPAVEDSPAADIVVDDMDVVPGRKPAIPQKNFNALLKKLNDGGAE